MYKRAGKKSFWSSLDPKTKSMLIAALSGAAGSAAGAYIGGKNHRALGALLGGGLAGGLALSAGPLQYGASRALGLASPPPKSMFSGVLGDLALGGAAVGGLHATTRLSRPTAGKLSRIFRDVGDMNGGKEFKKRDYTPEAVAARALYQKLIKAQNDYGRGAISRKDYNDRLDDLSSRALGIGPDLWNEGTANVFDNASKENRMGRYARFMADPNKRKRVEDWGTIGIAGLTGAKVLSRIISNRREMRRGWS